MKKCILVVAFGTSTIEGYDKQFVPFLERLKEETNLDVFIGFTSERIINKLNNNKVVSLENKINELKEKEYEKIILLKLILSDGKENQKIEKIIESSKPLFKSIDRTYPILAYKEEFIKVILKEENHMILISHGREDGLIDSISEEFKEIVLKNYNNLSFLSLNTKEEAKIVIDKILTKNIKDVVFKPLLLTKGHHFVKDIYSLEEDSFKRRFTENNIDVKEIEHGLLEDRDFINFIVEKVKNII